jgi:type III restriction enzyme
MYPGEVEEYVSVIGTNAFMEFVESIQAEGVVLERSAMGKGTKPKAPLIVEVDKDNDKKNLDELDIQIPILSPRVVREYKRISELDLSKLDFKSVAYKQFSEEEQREIVFKAITTGETTHTTVLDSAGVTDFRSVVGFFAQSVMKDLRLVSGYDVLYGRIKLFIQSSLFGREVELSDLNTLRNLSEPAATKTVIETFKKAVNSLTVRDSGEAEIRDTIKLRETRPFVVKDQGYIVSKKSVFNKTIGDFGFELEFASWLEDCNEVVSYAKNYDAVKFKLDYIKADGNLANYFPDFFVRLVNGKVVVVETKGRVDSDVPFKAQRLRQWCDDVNKLQSEVIFDFVYVDQDGFEKYRPKTFTQLLEGFQDYKGDTEAFDIHRIGGNAELFVRRNFGNDTKWQKINAEIWRAIAESKSRSVPYSAVQSLVSEQHFDEQDVFAVLALLSAPRDNRLRLSFRSKTESEAISMEEFRTRLRLWHVEKKVSEKDWNDWASNVLVEWVLESGLLEASL